MGVKITWVASPRFHEEVFIKACRSQHQCVYVCVWGGGKGAGRGGRKYCSQLTYAHVPSTLTHAFPPQGENIALKRKGLGIAIQSQKDISK